MKTIAKYLGGGPNSDNQMMKVFDLETKIASVSTVFRHLAVLVFLSFFTTIPNRQLTLLVICHIINSVANQIAAFVEERS